MWFKFGLIILLVYSTFLYSQAPRNSIYGGTPDTKNVWDSVVAIMIGSGQVCTGTVIDRKVILTAAHCVYGNENKMLSSGKVLLGVGGLFNGRNRYIKVQRAYIHPNYNGNKYERNDFAFLTLEESVPSEIKIIPMIGPQEANVFFEQRHAEVTFVGFGQRQNGLSGKKYVTESEVTFVLDTEFEAGLGDGRGTCFGDSGGPVFGQLNNGELRQVGVTSRGPGAFFGFRCRTDSGLYGRADEALRWYGTMGNQI